MFISDEGVSFLAGYIGFLVTTSLLLFFLYRDRSSAMKIDLWRSSLRGGFEQNKNQALSFWSRIKHEAKIAKIRTMHLGLIAFISFAVFALVLSIIEQSVIAGCTLGIIGSVALTRGVLLAQYNRSRTTFRRALFAEAVPFAARTMEATGDRLDIAFEETAAIAQHPRVKQEFLDLTLLWKPKQLTPEEALYAASEQWGVEEMVRLAVITKEAKPYNPDLAGLWIDYTAQVEQDDQHARMLKAKTAASRRNALIFTSIVFGAFLLAYPRFHEYLTPASQIAFWITIVIMLFGGYLIWRAGHKIEV